MRRDVVKKQRLAALRALLSDSIVRHMPPRDWYGAKNPPVRARGKKSDDTWPSFSETRILRGCLGEFGLASQRRPEGFARMMAALWLCLLLPMGGALAAAIWLKRSTINLNSMRVVRQQRPGSGAFGIGWAAVGRFSRSLRL